jgi:hypothetical protein
LTADTVGPDHSAGQRGFEGEGRVSGILAQLRELLANPTFAILLGLVLGIVLIAPLFWTLRRITSSNADMALYVAIGSVFGGLLVGLGLMMGYWFVSPEGFKFFGLATVFGFVLALGVLAVRAGMSLLSTNDTKG